MIAKVIPAIRLPAKASETYDYSVPAPLVADVVPGAVVIVPFAGRKIPALVTAVAQDGQTTRPLKEIFGFSQGLSPLPAYVVPLWEKMAKVFATTLPRLVWTALPPIPSRAIRTASMGTPGTLPAEPISPPQKPSSFFVNGPDDELKAVKNAVLAAGEGQVLILCPTIQDAMAWSKAVGGAAVYHSSLAAGNRYGIACATANGTVRAVAGTKSAVFLPWRHLAAVVIVSAGSSSHLQEDSDPRFDARIVAEALAVSTGARVLAVDSLIPVGFTEKGSDGRWASANSPLPIEASIHDLRSAAKAAKARVLLCEPLVSALDAAIDNDERVLVLLNRRGVSSSYVCRNCGNAMLCPSCSVPLAVHSDRQSCPSCERLYPLPESCPACKGNEFKPVGFGSKTIADALRKRYPTTKILHVDRDTVEAKPDAVQIVVGTTAVFRVLGPIFKPFDLAVETLLSAGTSRAGIWSVEDAARTLRSLASVLSAEGKLHVQTFDPSSPSLKVLSDPSAFIESEINERKAFAYPPLNPLITIHGALPDEKDLWDKAQALRAVLAQKMPAASVTEPAWSRPKVFRNKYRLTMAIKIKGNASYEGLAALLPNGFAAEVRLA